MAQHIGTSLMLLVKGANLFSEAHAVFQGYGIPNTSERNHYFDAAIGSEPNLTPYIRMLPLPMTYLVNIHIFTKQYPIFNYCGR